MSVLALLVDVLGPVVVLVASGALLRRRFGTDPAGMSTTAYWLLGPAFVFDNLAGAELEPELIVRLAVASLAGMVGAMVLAGAVTTWTGVRGPARAATLLTSAYGNVGNAGLAISAFALGDGVLPLASVVMLTINMTGLALGVWFAAARTTTPLRALGRSVTAPMTLAGVAAVVVNVTSLDLPLVAERPIGLLAGAMIPVMLITLGIQLVVTGALRWSPPLGTTAVAKLIAAPASAAAVGAALGLGGGSLAVVVIQSSMPPAVFCALIAIEHELEAEQVTAAVVATTLASLLTTPVVLALVT